MTHVIGRITSKLPTFPSLINLYKTITRQGDSNNGWLGQIMAMGYRWMVCLSHHIIFLLQSLLGGHENYVVYQTYHYEHFPKSEAGECGLEILV